MKWLLLWISICSPGTVDSWKYDHVCIHEHQEIFTIYRIDGKNERQILTVCDIAKEVKWEDEQQ